MKRNNIKIVEKVSKKAKVEETSKAQTQNNKSLKTVVAESDDDEVDDASDNEFEQNNDESEVDDEDDDDESQVNDIKKKNIEDEEDDDDRIYDPARDKLNRATKDVPQFTVILDLASLETVKTKKGDFQLLNCDDHIGLIRKFKKDPSDYRPDIIHQELMAVLDSPLNKKGKVRVLVRSEKNVLFEVNSKTRIPRTFKRFSGLMVQLLHRLKIRSSDGKDVLLKVIKNPISKHLPAGAKCIGFSHRGKLQSSKDLAKKLQLSKNEDTPIVLLFGAQATRGIVDSDHPYMEELVCISEFPLSGVVAINRVLGAIEDQLGIV